MSDGRPQTVDNLSLKPPIPLNDGSPIRKSAGSRNYFEQNRRCIERSDARAAELVVEPIGESAPGKFAQRG
jgi:hypothetical protein